MNFCGTALKTPSRYQIISSLHYSLTAQITNSEFSSMFSDQPKQHYENINIYRNEEDANKAIMRSLLQYTTFGAELE